ncbi:MAG: hypothetical protein UHM08_08730 [Bacteroidales bacterium]|nr:hypothetical protein [Bacteroidales bacterium]
MKFNPKEQELPFEGFNYGNRSYIRCIKDLDSQNKNGYGLLGTFMEKGEDEYNEGELYLSCSRGGEKDIYHLFTVENDEFKLLKTSSAQKGAVRTLWDTMEDFLSQRPVKSPQQLLNIVLEEEQNRDALKEFSMYLMKYATGGL